MAIYSNDLMTDLDGVTHIMRDYEPVMFCGRPGEVGWIVATGGDNLRMCADCVDSDAALLLEGYLNAEPLLAAVWDDNEEI